MTIEKLSFVRVVAAALILGAGGFGVLRGTRAEPIPIVPPPISVAEPRPDPTAPLLPTLGTFPLPSPPVVIPAVPVPALPTPTLPLPTLPSIESFPVPPKSTELVQLPQIGVPALPALPEVPANPEKSLRPVTPPLNLIPTEVALPKPLAPEAIPVGNEVPLPPRKIGNEIVVPPKPVVDELPTPKLVSFPTPIAPPTPTPGDFPMLSIKKLTLSTTLGVALALAPTSAIRAAEPVTQPDVKAIETALKKEISDLKEELKRAKELVSTLDEQVLGRKDGKVMVPADAGLMARMDKIEKAIKSMETKITLLDEAMSKRTVGSSPLEGTKPAAGMGKVKVVNEFGTKISIMVNDKSYPIDPSQTKEIEVAMGSFSYLLLADGTTKTTSAIKNGETVTLRIR